MVRIFLIGLICGLIACNSEQKAGSSDSQSIPVSLSPEITKVTSDSVEVLYYRKPFTDKERYTRFFSSLVTKDIGFIQSLKSILLLPGVKEDSLRACMSEGKINIPLKGDAYQVVYFSREEKPCNYLYVIRDGQFYYYLLDEPVLQKLNELEKGAKAL
jgi:hypothetical protein